MDVREKLESEKRLIDANAFLKDILTAGIGKTIIEYSESDIGYMIRKRPTVDAVPVVRCRDCKWSHTPYTDGFEKTFPGGALSCRMGRGLNQDPFGERLPNDDSLVSGDDFCSSGERKEGAEC